MGQVVLVHQKMLQLDAFDAEIQGLVGIGPPPVRASGPLKDIIVASPLNFPSRLFLTSKVPHFIIQRHLLHPHRLLIASSLFDRYLLWCIYTLKRSTER